MKVLIVRNPQNRLKKLFTLQIGCLKKSFQESLNFLVLEGDMKEIYILKQIGP